MGTYLEFDDKTGMYKSITQEQWLEKKDLMNCEITKNGDDWNMTIFADETPTDYVKVVRCKDCEHGEYREDYDDYECEASGCGLVNNADFYCADGERRKNK